jgi:nucleoid-associated protein YgaU
VPQDGKQPSREGRQPLDLRDAKTRESLVELIQKYQTQKLDVSGEKGNKLTDLLKDLGADKLTALKQMLQDTHGHNPPRFDSKFDLTTQNKVKDILDVIKDLPGRKLDGQDMGLNLPKSLNERLVDLLRNNEKMQTPEATKTLAVELTRIVRDMNQQTPVESGKNPLTIKDLIARSMDEATRSVEKGLLPGQVPLQEQRTNKVDVSTFNVRIQPGDEAIVRSLIEKVSTRSSENITQRQDVRTDSVAFTQRPDVRITEANITSRIEDARVVKDTSIRSQNIDASITSQISPQTSATRGTDIPTTSAGKDDLVAAQTNILNQNIRQSETEKAEKLDKKHKEDKEEMEREKEEKEKALREKKLNEAAMAALLAVQKLKDQKELEEQLREQKKLSADQRTKYVVKEGDTLESIANKMFRDKRLAGLIYEINKNTIPTRMHNGRNHVELRKGLVIYLPATREVATYRGRLLTGNIEALDVILEPAKFDSAGEELESKYGSNWSNSDTKLDAFSADAVALSQTRRQNIEKLLGPLTKEEDSSGRSKYVARLGDTLKSIAVKHPLLQDVSFWKLLAEINEITIEGGEPAISIKRGTIIFLPTAEEIDNFKQPNRLSVKQVPEVQVEKPKVDIEPTVNLNIAPKNNIDNEIKSLVENLSDAVRLIKTGNKEELNLGYKSQLEVLAGEKWIPVVSYEIYEEVALRHEFLPDGARKTIRIGLPPVSAIELAENDLSSNWTVYCDKYFMLQQQI